MTTRPLDTVAHPVRLRIVRHLSEAGRASLGELAEAAGVHENTARAHVSALEAGGLLISERRPIDRPGRPGVNYRLADPAVLAPSGLAQLLGAALVRANPGLAELRATGQDWGRYLSGRPGASDFAEKLPDVLDHLGFGAALDAEAVELRNCPCKAIAPERPELLAELAEGLVEGVLATCEAGRRAGHSQHDAVRGRCRIELVPVESAVSHDARTDRPRKRRSASA